MTVQTLRMAGDEWWRPIPRGVSRDAKFILTARALRAFADGFVSVLFPVYLLELGFSVIAIGAIVTATLIGSALLTLWVGIYAHRHKRRPMLLGACVLMAATGAGFALTSQFLPLLIIAFVGTLNPSSGDVSVFLPLEHTVLAQAADPQQRTALFARYSLAGALTGAVGTLAASLPDLAVEHSGMSHLAAMQAMFWLYGLIGALAFLLYEPLSPAVDAYSNAGIYNSTIQAMTTATNMVAFSIILWGISRAMNLSVFGVEIPGFLFWVAILYACFATGMMQLIGHSLSRLLFRQQAVEANFRFDLARIREFSEQIALLKGEDREIDGPLMRSAPLHCAELLRLAVCPNGRSGQDGRGRARSGAAARVQ